MTPALLTRMCSGPSQVAANDATEARTARSRGATATCLLPVVAMMSSAVCSPALVLRTAQGHVRSGTGERPGGLDPDPGGAARHDGPAAGEVNTVDDLTGG